MNKFWSSLKSNPFLTFAFILLAKDYLARFIIFNDFSIRTTLFISLPTIVIVLSLIELLVRKRKIWLYLACNIVLTSIYFAAIMYNKYFGIVVTYRALQQAKQVTEVNASVINLMHPYFLLIYIDVVVFALVYWLNRDFRLLCRSMFSFSFKRKTAASLLVVSLIISFSLVSANRHIVNEVKQADKMGILNYEVYTILKDLKPNERVDPAQITPEAVRNAKGIAEPAERKYWGTAEGKNVIVVQMESFQDFLIGLTVGGQEITPNLSRLSREGWYFPNIFQMVGQGNTSDAEFVLNTSFYIPEHGAASSEYAGKSLPSMPKLLKTKGYQSYTFHTNNVSFWNRENLYQALGFDKYYDDRFFGTEDMVAFGASDEVLYRKTVQELAEKQNAGEKFYANIISMSAHHPFHLPENKVTLKLPSKYDGTLTGNYLKAQHYADAAIGAFIDELKQQSLWDNSIVLFYGDHVGLTMSSLEKQDRTLLTELLGKQYAYDEMLNIPLIMHIPGQSEGLVLKQLGGQIDFMPTIANLLGVSLDEHITFGQDLLNHESNLLGERYYLPTGSFVNDSFVFVPGEEVKDGAAYPLSDSAEKDKPKQDEKAVNNDFQRALNLMNLSDSYVESLPNK